MKTLSHITLVVDYVNETFRWHCETSGFFGPEFETEHDANRWYESYIASA